MTKGCGTQIYIHITARTSNTMSRQVIVFTGDSGTSELSVRYWLRNIVDSASSSGRMQKCKITPLSISLYYDGNINVLYVYWTATNIWSGCDTRSITSRFPQIYLKVKFLVKTIECKCTSGENCCITNCMRTLYFQLYKTMYPPKDKISNWSSSTNFEFFKQRPWNLMNFQE